MGAQHLQRLRQRVLLQAGTVNIRRIPVLLFALLENQDPPCRLSCQTLTRRAVA